MTPVISVLTPSWNRATYLHKVWEGLQSQTFRDFEWIVGDDGSQDDTTVTVHALAKKSKFPVTLVSASQRVGKSRIDNACVASAEGKFVIWCDSDDVLLPEALSTLIATWQTIPVSERNKYCGVSALCETKTGTLGKRFYRDDENIDLPWNELFYRLNADLVIFARAELVKSNPFLEVDFLISESSMWSKIGVLQTRFIPAVLQRKNYGQPHALSFSGHMSYNRGHAYALALTKDATAPYHGRAQKLVRMINFLRYSAHGELPFSKSITLWSGTKLETFLLFCLFPVARLLAGKDSLQGKVRKTHREFLTAQSNATIQTESLVRDE